MSECAGANCTHPDCLHGQVNSVISKDESLRRRLGYSPEKWAQMNRRDRRKAARGKS